MIMEEIYRTVPGYEGKYEVSNLGNVRSLDRVDARGWRIKGRVLSPCVDKKGYRRVCLHDGQPQSYKVYRLVAIAFIPNPDNKKEVDHIDAVRHNDRADNLRWVTRQENNNNPITRANNSNAGRGRVFSNGHRRKIGEANRKRTITDETKKKIGASKMGNTYWVGRSHSEESRQKMKETWARKSKR